MRLPRLRLLATLLLAFAVSPAWAHGPAGPEPRIDPAAAPAGVARPVASTARSPESPVQRQLLPGLALLKRSGVGVAGMAGVLIVALGVAGLAPAWRRDRRMAIATATAALVLGFVIETTPHLVHHTLEADKGAGCLVLQTAERSQAAVGALDVTPTPAPGRLADPPSVATAPALAAPAPCGRAPPA